MATLKKLMTLLSNEGVTENRADIISVFTNGRTSSARNLNPEELTKLCDFFETKAKKQNDALDKKRKRVIAAVFGLFKKMNKTVSIDYVKAIASRAAKVKKFNEIPAHRLDSLYNAFLHAQKDISFSQRLVEGYILEQQNYN